MRRALLILLALSALSAAQKSAPIPDSQVPQRRQIFSNQRVTVNLLELQPNEGTPMHQHTRDAVAVFITPGQKRNTAFGKKTKVEKSEPGEVRYLPTGFAHATHNDAADVFRAVIVDFMDPQGSLDKTKPKKSHYCNPGSKDVCVWEHELFCTAKVCVEDVTMAPGAVTTRHSHSTDHMLVAVSDYELTDQIEGKGTAVRTRKSGEVEYILAGITHQLRNTGKQPAHFVVILWR